MNISMQFVRGVGALTLCAAVSAFALTQPVVVPDGREVAVAHSRLTIETVSDASNQSHYQVANVRVGKPIEVSSDQTSRVAQHATPVSDIPG